MPSPEMPNFPRRADLHHTGRSSAHETQRSVPASPSDEAPAATSDAPPTQRPGEVPTHAVDTAPTAATRQPSGLFRPVSHAAPSTRADEAPASPDPSGPPTADSSPDATPGPQATAQPTSEPATQSAAHARTAAPQVASQIASDEEFIETTGIRSRRLEQERQRSRRRTRNRRIRTFFIIVLVLALMGGAVYAAWNVLGVGSSVTDTDDDYVGMGRDPVSVTIFPGALGSDIGEVLVKNDVVKSQAAFIRAFEANKAAANIRPGTYSLKTRMSASEAIAALLDDANRTDNTVTVNPGTTVKQVVDKMKEVTEFDADAIDAALRDTAALGLPAEAGGKLEGWLAPGSYEIGADETPASLFKEMIQARIAELDNLKVAPADRQILLTKASILEREVDKDEYLGKVARVIENRLANPDGETVGLLQMDSTVLYGVGKTGGIPTAEDLASDTPYNTYRYKGLPAGPISNPNVNAIEAMLNPEPGSWLYFVSIDLETGETRFASTAAEHQQNKALLDQYCATHPDMCYK